jgi:hypothetical protein
MVAERFIISTGRSGSRMPAENRKVLQLSEFMATMDDAERFCDGVISGENLQHIISADDELSALTASGD